MSYLRLVKTAERNFVMIESLRTGRDTSDKKKAMKPQDYARLYDIVMQVAWFCLKYSDSNYSTFIQGRF